MDQLKQYWEIAKKQHFWILCFLAVFVPFIVFWVASGHLAKTYADQMGTIKRVTGDVTALNNEPSHPNEQWVKHVQDETEKLRLEVKDKWEKLYKQQQAVLKWPPELGTDFIAAFGKPAAADDPRALEPLCERYQNNVKTELSHMADIVKARWAPGEGANGHAAPKGHVAGAVGAAAGAAEEADTTYIVNWDTQDQGRLVDNYDWQDPPSPLDVRYAQEELWVLEAICESIKRTNVGATGDFDAVVREIQTALIGYVATDKFPLGEGANRIERARKTPGMQGAMAPPPPMNGAPGGPAGAAFEPVQPMRHRTTDEGSLGSLRHRSRGGPFVGMPGGPMPGAAPTGPADPDDWLKDGRFVDTKGKPLRGSEWATLTTPEFNLMAFKLVIIADEQRWQKLLVELSNSPLPLEVREVRINASDREGGAAPGMASRGRGGREEGGQDNTMHNVTLEIRGVAYLMNPPNTPASLAKLGLPAAGAALDAAPAAPPAATTPIATPPTAAPPAGAPTPAAPATPAIVPPTGTAAAPAGAPAATTPPVAVPPTTPPTGAPASPPTTPATAPPAVPPTTAPPAATPPATPAAK